MALIGRDELGNAYAIAIDAASGAITTTRVQNQTPSVADASISVTAMSLIASALRLIRVLATGESPQPTEAADALVVFDQMIDAWNADRLAVFTTRADDFALIPGKQSYTFGIGGDFNSNRPAQIDSMSAILTVNPGNPIEVPIDMYSVSDWQNKVPVKNVPGTFPLICYDDGGFPLRTLNFWPIPQQANSVRIYSWQPLGLASTSATATDQLGYPYQITIESTDGALQVQKVQNQVPLTLQTSISFPPGYAEAFRYNLAVRLADEYGVDVPANVGRVAITSLATVRSMNAPDLSLQSDLVPSPAGYNWKADMFGIPY